jgi:LysM repeat protein
MKRRNKATAWIAAILVGVGAVGLYFHQQGLVPPGGIWQEAGTGTSSPTAPERSLPQAAAPAETPSQPQIGETGAVALPAKPMAVPSFDVVLVQPNGEGVLAGRAEPGWTVNVQSGGSKVAEATADTQGEWSIVLEKPLPPGDHALSLKTTSPDGTSVLTSQDSVPIAVGTKDEKVAAPPREAELEASAAAEPKAEALQSPATRSVETQSATREPQVAVAVAESEKPHEKAKITLNTVDYQDIGTEAGKLTVTGTTDPGQPVSLSFDGEALANVTANGVGIWRLEVDKKLGLGQHTLRAERYDSTQKLAALAAITFERAKPAPQVVTEAKPSSPPSKPQVASVETSQAGAAQDASGKPEVYIIRRGDTLWDIAKRYLGSGLRYSSIFQGNREVIRNPNLILPQQKVKMPTP